MTTIDRDLCTGRAVCRSSRMLESDYGTPHRQAFIKASQYLERQRQQAIAWLGPRWLLHPANAVQKVIPISDPVLERHVAQTLDTVIDFTNTVTADDFNIHAFLHRQAP